MNEQVLSDARFFEWNDLPLLTRSAHSGEEVLNCAFDPPRVITSAGLLRRAREISVREFERLRAVHRAAWRQHFDDQPRDVPQGAAR